MSFLSSITHKNCTKLIFLQYTVTFCSDNIHFLKEIFNF